MMERHKGRTLHKGYTTGSCATAAARIAALMILRQQIIEQISLTTSAGVTLFLSVEHPLIEGQQATAAICTDGGDDIDATHDMLIYARVSLNNSGVITIDGGEGIGRITRAGLGLYVGTAAIHKTSRQMIELAVREVIGSGRGADIVIFAPEGEKRACKTYNVHLGIEGGISIIGASDSVNPMSEESWKRALAIELETKRAQGLEQIILVPSNDEECLIAEHLTACGHHAVVMSNFVGYMLQECVRLGFRHVVLVGYAGKLVKIAAGIFHTHSHVADCGREVLIANLALLGAPFELLYAVEQCATTEAAIDLINKRGWQNVFELIAKKICQRIDEMLRFSHNRPVCDAILFSLDNPMLGANRPVNDILADFSRRFPADVTA
ncbi:cobalt-precorrin-5B (C(1))-methyltransferase CbiD [Hafnia alvei]|uniref:Cobalt-precorrin-5B C(1)-methyltransferase n=1 Tax=Hafnia alvei TaxID=569 RepID=A0A1C6YVL1_HAFAL|nr:cobalt-precorrin-5B (C(1))-methyltransferase CbiD [Hafnia alvei]SCM50910.1 cobalt-precorrin-5B (C1)-methyltransferase [Hafnia alvei]